MPEQLVPNLYDVLHSAASSPWVRRVLQDALTDDRDPAHTARDARLVAAVLDARAEAWRNSVVSGAAAEREVVLVDVFLPIDADQPEAERGNVIAIDFPNASWRANAGA